MEKINPEVNLYMLTRNHRVFSTLVLPLKETDLKNMFNQHITTSSTKI